MKTEEGFQTALKLIETINRATDDYLFIWEIQADTRWFFGDIDKYYDIRKNGSETNSTPEMLKIIYPADRGAVLRSLEQISNGEKDIHNMDYRWINRKGETVWINCHGTVIRDNENKPYIMIGRVSEENLRHLYNPLTGLWNKNKLRIDLKTYLQQEKRFLMLLDIDGLTTINLTHGRSYGDALLKEVSEICENADEVENAYHVDHNYFALVLNVATEEMAHKLYEQVKTSMSGKCTFTSSVVPIDNILFYDETQLLDAVNMTLKKAKDISNNRIEFFSSEDLSRKIDSFELLEELKRSIQKNYEGFEIYYQAQILAGSYDIYGVEALLRYNSQTRGMVFPSEFIPILEESRLIKDVGMWVLHEALVQCKKWREFLPLLHVSVNFCPLQFEDAELADKIIDKLRGIGVPSDALTVEITESVELHSNPQIVNTIMSLKEYHINLAIDDFGTGYANLGYLKQLNVDEIKIDRLFVSGIEKGTYNHKLINNIIEFAKDNDIRTCCEGVENARELVTLETLLPDIFQGYLFHKPSTAELIEKTYIDSSASEFKERIQFICKINELKEKMGVVHFDPKDILRENGVGLWVMRIKHGQEYYELHVDATMEQLLEIKERYTPTECFDFWFSNIRSDYSDTVKSCIKEMISGNNSVQIEFVWSHPQGDVLVRFSGKRVKSLEGMIILEGYYRNITNVTSL